jgi:ribokinase
MVDVLVIGSMNIELTTVILNEPKVGETIYGKDFHLSFGGKGANQAVGISRLGVKTLLLGCLGSDIFGAMLKENLKLQNVDLTYVEKVEGQSGVTTITLNEYTKENKIVVLQNANALLTKRQIRKAIDNNPQIKVVVLQLEIPLHLVEYTIELCKERAIKTILNPSPYQRLNLKIIDSTDFIILNENEYYQMFENINMYETLSNYPLKMIVTKGSQGAVYHDGIDLITIPAIEVEPIDTRGAGDAFVAAFTVAFLQNMKISECISVANVCAGLSTTKLGAQQGLISKEALMNYIKKENN